MKHNRPFYGKTVTVIITGINKHFITHIFPRWLEQTYKYRNYIIVGHPKYYFDVKRLSKRYGIESTFGEIYQNSKCHYMTVEPKDEEIESEITSYANSTCIPVAYYLDMVMSAVDYNNEIDCCGFKSRPKNKPSETIFLKNNLLGGSCESSKEKCCVYIPVMNREKSLCESFEGWMAQTYENTQIVIIDYSSTVPIINTVIDLADKFKRSVSTDPKSEADIIVLRIENQKFFNISHAYNFAVKKTESEVLLFVCADSIPWDFYIELCMNLIDNKKLLQVHWGIHTITRENWKKLNGHQEFVVGWGAEDDDFRIRSNMIGLENLILPPQMMFQIPQNIQDKGKNRMIKDLSESSLTNMTRFQQYNAYWGPVANYGEEVGNEESINYRPTSTLPEKPLRLYCFEEKYASKLNLNEKIQTHPIFKMCYVLTRNELVEKIDVPHYHFFVQSDIDIDKYLQAIGPAESISAVS